MAIRKFVILVAGHDIDGDPGAIGQGTQENIETVQIVDRVHALLAPHPNIVVVTVPHNLDYVDSTNWINKAYKNLDDGVIVEVHKNSAAGSATGIETFTGLGPDALTTKLATKVNDAQVASTGLRNRGVKQGNFYLITMSNQRAVLTESGFIKDDGVNDEWDAKYANGIANGICDFFGEARPKVNVPLPAPVPTPPPAPLPAAPKPVLYHVIVDGKQVGAYSNIGNAYNKWNITGRKGIIRDGAGADITNAVATQFTPAPVVPEPVVVPVPEVKPPVIDIDYAKENNGLLKTIMAKFEKLLSLFNFGGK